MTAGGRGESVTQAWSVDMDDVGRTERGQGRLQSRYTDRAWDGACELHREGSGGSDGMGGDVVIN